MCADSPAAANAASPEVAKRPAIIPEKFQDHADDGNPPLAVATEAIVRRRLAAARSNAGEEGARARILLDALPDAAAALDAAAPLIAAAERERWTRIEPDPDQPGYNRGVFDVSGFAAAVVAEEREKIRAEERDRAEALIIQAQDYASAESERAGKLAGLALKALNECQALHPTGEAGYLDEWGMALDQLESAAGEMSPPGSDPLEEANQAGIKWERERVIRLAEERSATCLTHHGEPGYPEAGQFADLLREDGNEPA